MEDQVALIEETRDRFGRVISSREVTEWNNDGCGCLIVLFLVAWVSSVLTSSYPWLVVIIGTILFIVLLKLVVTWFRKAKYLLAKIFYAVLGVGVLFGVSGGIFESSGYIINPSSRCEQPLYKDGKCKQMFEWSTFDPHYIFFSKPTPPPKVKKTVVRTKSKKKSTASSSHAAKTSSQ